MDRKLYGDIPAEEVFAGLSSVGDPEFVMDSQDNDNYYNYDTDARTRE